MGWKIEFDQAALYDLKKLNKSVQLKLISYLKNRIATLDDPRTSGKPLHGLLKGLWRYRIESYRILCKIEDDTLTILVIAAGHRSKIYEYA